MISIETNEQTKINSETFVHSNVRLIKTYYLAFNNVQQQGFTIVIYKKKWSF